MTIVIGGGLAGVTTLHALAGHGREVMLLDAAPELATVASFANGGLLTPSMSDPWNGPGVGRHLLASLLDPYAAMKLRLRAVPGLLRWGPKFLRHSTRDRHESATRHSFSLAFDSVRRTRELSAELGLRYDAAAAGALKIFGDAQALAGPLGMANMLARQGLRFQVLQRDEVIAMEPQLAPAAGRIGCAIYFPDDMSGDACAFTRALADQASLAGATIRASALVERILVEAGRVRGVVVRGERIAADQVVVAAGCASPRLVAPLGVPLSIAPVKGYTVTVDLRHVAARPRIPIVDDAMHAALTPLGDRMRVAGTAEFSGNDVALSPHRIANLFRLLERIYPQLAQQVDRRTAFAWTGLRPMSADGLPFIGAAGPQGLWINSGHGHLGWTLAVGSAALLASLMREEAPSVEPGPYRVRR